MKINIQVTQLLEPVTSIAIIAFKSSPFESDALSKAELDFAKSKIENGDTLILINQYQRQVFIVILDDSKPLYVLLEDARKAGSKVQASVKELKIEKLQALHMQDHKDILLAFTEGLVLSDYRFIKYFKNSDEKKSNFKTLALISNQLDPLLLNNLVNSLKALYKVRDLVNEPVSHLNAEALAEEFISMGKEAGFTVEVFNKNKIEALRMGGLLAVNKGSVDPPTFTVMEWKPSNPINSKPYVLVGKGVVYDTGGLSLKPTTDSMDYMKSDMSGAAIVAGVLYTLASNKVPVHVVALVPATDNRPSGNAYAPGDIVTIMDGTNVEMLNSDAEGRMILADALVYAKSYNPELVIDVATLTGSAMAAIGPYALVAMGTASESVMADLKKCGDNSYERIVEFPLWSEYGELLKSDIADIKNVGGKLAGAITGGKFLENFISYPWVHFDIAGVAFNKKNDNYRVKGGTGFSMRLLVNYFENLNK